MKLVYIANVRMPTEKAHGIQIMKTCEALSAAGVDLELWVPKRRNAVFSGVDPFEYYKITKSFSITYLSSLDFIGLLDFLPGAGYFIQSRTFAWSVGRKLSGLNLPPPRSLGKLEATPTPAGGESATIYYSRELSALAPVVRLRATFFYEAHTLPKRFKDRDIEILKQAAGVVCISQHLAETFKEYLPEQKILVAPDGVDLKIFSHQFTKQAARQSLGFPGDAKIVGYSGHLYEWKGARILAEASEGLDADTIVFFLGGTEADQKTFRELCEARRYKRVRLLGSVPPDRVPLYLAAADVLVLPNSGKFEISRSHTSPLKLFEYMAAERPIVASDLPSIREILDESTAIFFIPDDPLSLARRIKALFSDQGLSERLAVNASRKVAAYSWEARTKQIKQFIESWQSA